MTQGRTSERESAHAAVEVASIMPSEWMVIIDVWFRTQKLEHALILDSERFHLARLLLVRCFQHLEVAHILLILFYLLPQFLIF